MIHKLKSQRGETLVEIMASVLVAALSVALLFSCVMAASQINSTARESDEKYYATLTAAEKQETAAGGGTVKIAGNGSTETLDISLYGGSGMYSYARGVTGP